ncbi:hypothetical protein LSCM1_04856 [Leishmania martiniquensis]|uniref:Uncharacterized protein n=1 Tax=Leishmania martiniquensis TaxID=1580590 RepID=A0A836HVG5_9TRYP|nr:hypothetical protein LSCM1_04856 [Leishmania martiniquensis]
MPSAGSAVSSGASLTVDELEEKLANLRDYLSTPYRARAEAILHQRRRREATASTSVPGKVLPEAAESKESRDVRERVSVPFHYPTPNPTPSLEVKSAPAVSTAVITTGPKSRCSSERQLAQGGGGSGVPAPSPAAHASVESLPMDPHTRRYIQQLEWQVNMLADALQQERKRLTEMDARVVQPLLRLGEAALQRQVQLEYALASCRVQGCNESDSWHEEVSGEREVDFAGSGLVDTLTEAKVDTARS